MAFLLRSKRRKHSVDVDTIIKHMSQLSHTSTSLSGRNVEENVEDFMVMLNDMLTMSRDHDSQTFADVSTLDHTLQVVLSSLSALNIVYTSISVCL